jgi:Zn-dependent protease with chaperone function
LKILSTLLKDAAIVIGSVTLITLCYTKWVYLTSWEYQVDRANRIYRELIAQTGQVQDRIPLVVSKEPILNASNSGTEITVYAKLLEVTNDDELALILGHEIAHGMLGHLAVVQTYPSPIAISVLEGNADKMGAIYMMKAGYNICRGREIFKTWRDDYGNALGQDHPAHSYRYEELNIRCGR